QYALPVPRFPHVCAAGRWIFVGPYGFQSGVTLCRVTGFSSVDSRAPAECGDPDGSCARDATPASGVLLLCPPPAAPAGRCGPVPAGLPPAAAATPTRYTGRSGD